MAKGSTIVFLLLIGLFAFSQLMYCSSNKKPPDPNLSDNEQSDSSFAERENADLIEYGKELMANTSHYLGPKGMVATISNGMNCQNCHLDAGTRVNGNNFLYVASGYPRYRNRSGRIETIAFRINDCMQRSMNGQPLDSNSREMKAMTAYLLWVGKHPPSVPKGSGSDLINYLDRPADSARGRILFMKKCITCHGSDGQGLLKEDSMGYVYPPLWGIHSYNIGAGLYRLTSLASFIKYNMPFQEKPTKPQLSDEQCWDLAAFIASQKRPVKFFSEDWPVLTTKPVDYPFGPFPDSFSASQHKFGPFSPIEKARRQLQ